MADDLPGGQPVLTFYTKPGDDFVPGIEQDGTIVSIAPFSCGEHEVSKFFFVSGVPKETITVYQDSSWFTVDGGSVYEDANNPNERCLRITVKPNAGLERTGLFTVVGDGTMSYLVQVSQFAYTNFKLSGMTVLNATCTSGDCNIDKYHYSCNRKSLIVLPELPERGEEGTTYFIGSHTMGGFTEYVWSDASGWVKMGVAEASLVAPATTEKMGLAKLGTDAVIIGGADVGMNGSLQLKVPMATHEAAGAVKLGSMFEGKNAEPYRVGITADNNSQLVFNLKEGGSLKYERSGDKWELRVVDAADGQKGVVALTSSLTGLTDSEIEARRNTNAASVGLVLDGLESYVRSFVTADRISGYFSDWASNSDIPSVLWANYQSNILNGVGELVLTSDSFQSFVSNWIEERYTNEKFVELFGGSVKTWTEEKAQDLAEDYWGKNIENTIKLYTNEKVVEVFPAQLGVFLTDKSNVTAIANAVKDEVKSAIASEKDNIVTDYLQDVMDGKIQISVGGVATSFPSFVESKVEAEVEQTLNELSNRQTLLESKVNKCDRFAGLTKIKLLSSAGGEVSGVFSYANDSYKFIAIKCANYAEAEFGGSYTAMMQPFNIAECLSMDVGGVFRWQFDGGHPESGIGGVIKVTESTVSVEIKHRWTDYVDCRLIEIYAWK